MRTFTVLRVLALATALSAPLAQAALAGQQEQQALVGQSAVTAPSFGVGPYSDAALSPAVGD
ncbi:MAG: hypothetical protein KGL11_12125 [Alphaproteobacteria bacterium]|nr:hypothetical protein [Alphaproteobacteria bacterium]